MLKILKKLLGKEVKNGYVSAVKFRDNIKAEGIELFNGHTVLYLSYLDGENQLFVYRVFSKKELMMGSADSFDAIQTLARKHITNKFKN